MATTDARTNSGAHKSATQEGNQPMDMQAFAVAMSEALDGAWTVEPGHHGHRDRYLIGPDGEELHVCYSDWEKTPRLRLSASLPAKLATIRHRHGNPAPSHDITVSPAKTPKTVAAETARRLLPVPRAAARPADHLGHPAGPAAQARCPQRPHRSQRRLALASRLGPLEDARRPARRRRHHRQRLAPRERRRPGQLRRQPPAPRTTHRWPRVTVPTRR